MNEKAEFLKKLNGLVETAKKQGGSITIEEVQNYFSQEALTEEQTELVFDYLLSQKIGVKGYVKLEAEAENKIELTEEEKAYLEEYVRDLTAFEAMDESAKKELAQKVLDGDEMAKSHLIEVYLQDVVEMAKSLKQQDVFLGDLIQEGNMGLVIGVEAITDAASAHEVILTQIKQSMQIFLEEYEEVSNRDKKMVEKVNMLDEAITNLTEDLGRKVTIDELALYMGMEIDEIEDILKLTGEEAEEA